MILLLLKLETSSELVLFISLMILNGLYYVLVVIQKPAHVPGYHFSHQWTSILEVFFFLYFSLPEKTINCLKCVGVKVCLRPFIVHCTKSCYPDL